MAGRVLITGGAGFLGSSLARVLCKQGPVVLLDNLLRNALGQGSLLREGSLTLLEGDVRDRKIVARAMTGCDRVVHMASVAGVDAVERDPVGTLQVILEGTQNVLDAGRQQGQLRRIVIVSSSEVYGPKADGVDESRAQWPADPGVPRWSYAIGKLAAECLALANCRQYGLPVTVIRPFNVYGPGQVGQGAVRVFLSRALAGLPLELHNGGYQVRAWCYVDDFVQGVLAALEVPAALGEVFNLGDPHRPITTRELAGKIRDLVPGNPPPEDVSRDGPEVDVRIPDISRARRLLGFRPGMDLDEGLRRTLAWVRQRSTQRREGLGG